LFACNHSSTWLIGRYRSFLIVQPDPRYVAAGVAG
jgi:hypothetical protein